MGVTVSHRLPGRLRVFIEEMRNQPVFAYSLQYKLSQTGGICELQCNPDTGRALIRFDENRISQGEVIQAIDSFLDKVRPSQSVQETAATLESEISSPGVAGHPSQESKANPYRLPTLASATLLGVLSLKRILMGRSALATSPLTFWAAAGATVVAGYPTLRRGIETLVRNRKVTPDLWLGLATLSTAALRENLVGISLITVLNVAMYRRYAAVPTPENTHLDPEIERHSQAMSRLSLWLAPLAMLFTRSPMRAIAVALAANPRPAILSHKYRWARAEQEVESQRLLVHSRPGLTTLAYAKSIVFSDESVCYGTENEWMVYPLKESVDTGKIIGTAASLLQKSNIHPWRNALIERATQDKRTLHTPFDVEASGDGIRGVIQGQTTLFGGRSFVSKFGVDDTQFQLEERRIRRQGFETQVLTVDGHPLAIIGCKRSIDSGWEKTFKQWTQSGYRIRSLRTDRFQATHFESVTAEQLMQDLDHNVTTIFVGREPFVEHPCLAHISDLDVARLPQILEFCGNKRTSANQDLRIVKMWNWIGTAIALVSPVSAPFIALTGDVVGMYLIAAQHWIERFREKFWHKSKPKDGETAAKPGVTKNVTTESTGGGKYYFLSVTELLEKLGTQASGLSLDQVKARRGLYGSNRLVAPGAPNPIVIFLNQFKELSTLILLGTAGVSFVMGEGFSALCMLGILVVNAMIGTWQEKRSSEVIQALKVNDDSQTKVIRDAAEEMISTTDLVPGDVVFLESGHKVPADIRILDAWSLEVNEAALTGESTPVSKYVSQLTHDTPLADRSNSLFMGTMITRGRCIGVVIDTGSATEIGRLGSLMNDLPEAPTFLQSRVAAISKRFVVGALIAAGVVVAAGLFRGLPLAQLLISSVTLAASAIPEGLPLTITVALTAGVLQMSKRKAVIKKLANLESLGRVTVICSDKTGTLTSNEMTVKEIATVSDQIVLSERDAGSNGDFTSVDGRDAPESMFDHPDLRQLLTIGVLCNNAQLSGDDQVSTGDPTEKALLTIANKVNLNVDIWKRHREIPFDSATRSMSVVCKEDEQATIVCEDDVPVRRCTLFTKGAPEAILDKCTHFLRNGEVCEITEEIQASIRDRNLEMADRALRVIALAYKDICDDEDPMQVSDDKLVYVGMTGMIDPPKEGVSSSIAKACSLGIKPVMITGDHPLTARAIAAQVGIFQQGDRVLTGQDLDKLSQDELDKVICTASVFARVSPEHKLRIVETYQRAGEVVAMTGDGVNDAPAIRKADVGIAMGRNGTDITKGTAGIVLMEDHFDSILEGVRGGRSIIGNIRKAMGCLLAGNLAEVLVTALSVIIGLPMPLIPLQILMMNILTDAVPAIVLATGAPSEVQQTPYHDVIDKTLYRTVLTRGAVLGVGAVCVFATALAVGMTLPLAQTMAYASLVAGQLLQISAWRKYGSRAKVNFKRDRVLLTATVGSWIALAATIYIPGFRMVFGTVPLGLSQWGIVLAVTSGLTWFARQCIERFVDGERVQTRRTDTADYALTT